MDAAVVRVSIDAVVAKVRKDAVVTQYHEAVADASSQSTNEEDRPFDIKFTFFLYIFSPII